MVGIPEDEVARLSVIDPWFVSKLKNIVEALPEGRAQRARGGGPRPRAMLCEAKQLGFSDKQIANAVEIDEDDVRAMRERMGINAAGEGDRHPGRRVARTDELPLRHLQRVDGRRRSPTDRRKVMVLGAGTVQDRELRRVRLGDHEHGVGAEGEREGRRDDRGELQPRRRSPPTST